ncbi:MAG: nucleotidyltransferase family protein [Caldilineales bacterium]|nr:nucleotidyltransferase family protein [Caldilineales bacterium]MCW5858366.1 hypothetical protein [Caldilineales bacterium]
MDTLELAYESELQRGGEFMLREASAFFDGGGRLRETLRRLAERLEAEGIAYALVGGLALAEHGYPRLTEHIDIVLTGAGLAQFTERWLGRGYRPAFEGARKSFRDAQTGVRIEILLTGEYPGDGLPKPVAFPDPAFPNATIEIDGIHVIALDRLIEMKLASGLSAGHRLRDLADVQDLIGRLDLPLELAERLHPSVVPAYKELWEQVQAGKAEET